MLSFRRLAEVAAAPAEDQSAAAVPAGAKPTAGEGREEEEDQSEEQTEEQAKLEEHRRSLASRTTVPDFTEQTIGIISRIASGQIV